jgi:hypothetical protein
MFQLRDSPAALANEVLELPPPGIELVARDRGTPGTWSHSFRFIATFLANLKECLACEFI